MVIKFEEKEDILKTVKNNPDIKISEESLSYVKKQRDGSIIKFESEGFEIKNFELVDEEYLENNLFNPEKLKKDFRCKFSAIQKIWIYSFFIIFIGCLFSYLFFPHPPQHEFYTESWECIEWNGISLYDLKKGCDKIDSKTNYTCKLGDRSENIYILIWNLNNNSNNKYQITSYVNHSHVFIYNSVTNTSYEKLYANPFSYYNINLFSFKYFKMEMMDCTKEMKVREKEL